ncbi:MAG TPA: LemA family protein [Burkholderiales bacterium]
MTLELYIAFAGTVLIFGGVWLYNRLVAARNLARQGFADIDVQLKRRADLVPQLVEAVRGYAAYEKALLTTVTELRSAALADKSLAARFGHERQLGEGLKQLVLLQEAYPQLKADANFRQLSQSLVEVEDHLQSARRFYNGAVKQYQTQLESFPDILVARVFRFAPLPFFETEEREGVRVSLSP